MIDIGVFRETGRSVPPTCLRKKLAHDFLEASNFGHLGAQSKIESLVHAIYIAPSDPKLYTQLGDVLVEQGKHEDAIGEYKIALSLLSRRESPYDLYLKLAQCHAALGKNSTAFSYYQHAIQDSEAMRLPEPKPYISMIFFLMKNERLREADILFARMTRRCGQRLSDDDLCSLIEMREALPRKQPVVFPGNRADSCSP